MNSNIIDNIPQNTTNNEYINPDVKDPLLGIEYSEIFKNKFINGETALDEMNMNTLLHAIEKNNLNMDHIIKYLNERINTINDNFTSIDTAIDEKANTTDIYDKTTADGKFATIPTVNNVEARVTSNEDAIKTINDTIGNFDNIYAFDVLIIDGGNATQAEDGTW